MGIAIIIIFHNNENDMNKYLFSKQEKNTKYKVLFG
ncbi:MAG: hypothetical protein ACI840_001622 [Ulvibacter sp.]|jgi:hypothetical protein